MLGDIQLGWCSVDDLDPGFGVVVVLVAVELRVDVDLVGQNIVHGSGVVQHHLELSLFAGRHWPKGPDHLVAVNRVGNAARVGHVRRAGRQRVGEYNRLGRHLSLILIPDAKHNRSAGCDLLAALRPFFDPHIGRGLAEHIDDPVAIGLPVFDADVMSGQ